MELARDFGGISSSDVDLAGGKGASLGEMTQAGIPVPPGFVVLSTAFKRFLNERNIEADIESILDNVNHEDTNSVEQASEKIEAIILNEEMPEDIEEEILEHFDKLDSKFVAVRSSATAEDSASAAWAGQLETYLNTTKKDILDKVKKCWASLFTPRAIFYRFEKGLEKELISVAVVVQKMVQSEVSGIAFSVHPVTQDRNQMIIEAGYGLGEAIVSGQITPDSYVVEKDSGDIVEKSVQEQEKGIFRKKKNGGNEWKELEDGSGQKLSNNEVEELAEVVVHIEDHYGFPVDVEWCKEGDTLYIVQSRPITTLTNFEEDSDKNVKNEIPEEDSYEYTWGGESLPLLIQSMIMKSYMNGVSNGARFCLQKDGKMKSYSSDKFLKEAENIGRETYSDIDSAKKHCDKIVESKEKIFSYSEVENLNGDTLKDFIKEAENFLKLYLLLDPEFTEQVLKEKDDSEVISYLGDKKNECREYLNKIFFVEDSILRRVLEKVSDKTGITIDELMKYTAEEFENVFSEQPDSSSRKNYLIRTDENRIEYSYDEEFVGSVWKAFVESDSDEGNLSGTVIVGAGKYKGKVKMVDVKYDEDITKQADTLNKESEGYILVADHTTPELVPLMKKSTAIVTNQGGLLSHAAIIAREFNIPCIVGTSKATEVLKEGSMVEVDADSGVVKKTEKTSDYVFLWGDYQPLRDVELNIDGLKNQRDIPWNKVDNIVQVSRNNITSTYHSKKDLENDFERGKKYFDEEYCEEFIEDMEATLEEHKEFYKQLREKDFPSLSDEKLLEIFEESRERWERTISFFRATQQEGTQLIMEKLKEHFSAKEVSILITPPRPDEANKEQMDWQELVKKPYSEEMLLEHAYEHPWVVKCHFTYEDVIKTLKQRYDFDKDSLEPTDIEKEKEELREHQKRIIEDHPECWKRPEIKRLIKFAQRLAISRMEVKACWAGTDFNLIPVMQEIAKRSGEDVIDLNKKYVKDEVRNLLLKGDKLSEEEKERRDKCYVGVWKDGEKKLYSGEEAEKVAEEELGSLYEVEKKDVLKGEGANPGKARGKARLLFANDVEHTREVRANFEKGGILITQMTQPNVVDIASKAGALVTDEGGMLSHAAIISREFDIPCVVGTHTATKDIEDGDLVEVDANNGTVKLLSSKRNNPEAWNYWGTWKQVVLFSTPWAKYAETEMYKNLGLGHLDGDLKNLRGSFYFLQEDLEKMYDAMVSEMDNGWFEKAFDLCDEAIEKMYSIEEGKDLSVFINRLVEHMGCSTFTEMADFCFEKFLKEKCGKEGVDYSKLTSHMNPDRKTLMGEYQERLDELEEAKVDDFLEEWKWIGTHALEGEPLTRGDVLEEMEVEGKEKEEEETEEVPEGFERYVEIGSKLSFYRAQLMDVLNKVAFSYRRKMEELADELGISYYELISMTEDELLTAIEEGEIPDNLSKRKKNFGYVRIGKSPEILLGDELEEELEIHKTEEELSDEVKGRPAYKGKVTGIARILTTREDVSKVKDGDIIVASETTPEYIMAMRKAAAFVTDLGGITSHAAIVSREMQKPCIIGTKNATKAFKDGDMVEVDADEGMVRKIE